MRQITRRREELSIDSEQLAQPTGCDTRYLEWLEHSASACPPSSALFGIAKTPNTTVRELVTEDSRAPRFDRREWIAADQIPDPSSGEVTNEFRSLGQVAPRHYEAVIDRLFAASLELASVRSLVDTAAADAWVTALIDDLDAAIRAVRGAVLEYSWHSEAASSRSIRRM